MASNKEKHLGNRADYQDAAAYLEDYGTLEGWEAPVGATYKTGEELMDFWKSAGVDKNNDGTLSADELKPQMDATLKYWNAKPKRSKMNAISEEFRRTLPYVAAVAPFAPAGSFLGSIAKGTSSLGKLGSIMTGGGKFAKSPIVNALIKQAISKAAGGAGMETLGKTMQFGSVGHGAADMFNKGIYAPQKIMAGDMPMGTGAGGRAVGDSKYRLSDIGSERPDQYTLGGMNDPNAGNQYGLGGSLEDLPPLGSDNPDFQEILDLQKYNINPDAGKYGGQMGQIKLPPIPGIGTGAATGGAKPGGGSASGGGAGGGQNLLAMGLLTGMLGKAFEGDNKPAPAPPASPGTSNLPSYANLLGFATTSDAIEDQKNRLKFKGRYA